MNEPNQLDPTEQSLLDVDPSNFIAQQQRAVVARGMSAANDNPEQAERALRVSDATGLPAPVVYDDVDHYEQQAKERSTAQILSDNKWLRDYIDKHPVHSKLSSDDWSNLDQLTEVLEKLPNSKSSATGTFFRSVEKGAISAAGSVPAMAHGAMVGGAAGSVFGPWGTLIGGLIGAGAEGMAASYGIAVLQDWLVGMLPSEYTRGGAFDPAQQALDLAEHPEAAFWGNMTPYLMTMKPTNATLGQRVFGGTLGAAFEAGGQVHEGKFNPAHIVEAFGAGAVFANQNRIGEALWKRGEEIGRKITPWLKAGKHPPVGLDPVIDEAYKIQADNDLKNLDEAMKIAKGSNTIERSEEAIKYIGGIVNEGRIGVSAEAVAKLYGDEIPHPDDGKLGFVPDLAEQLASAKESGGDVYIPLKDWLAHVDPEVHKALHDDIRVRSEGVTKNEAKELKVEVKGEEPAAQRSRPKQGSIEEDIAQAPRIPLAQLLKEGDMWQSPFLTKEGEIIATGGDHLSLANPEEILANGLVRFRFGPTDLEGQQAKALSVELIKGQSLTPKQRAVLDRLGHKTEFYGDLSNINWERVSSHKSLDELVEAAKVDSVQEAVDNVRKAAGLEPLAQRDIRKLKLERNKEFTQEELNAGIGAKEGEKGHDFNIVDEEGKEQGFATLRESADGKDLHVEYIAANPAYIQAGGQANKFGPKLVRGLLRQLKQEFPNAERLFGFRVSGARDLADTWETHGKVFIPLEKQPFVDLKKLEEELSGGKWEDMLYGIQAYTKPEKAQTRQQRRITAAVNRELAKFKLQNVEVKGVHAIEEKGAAGTTGMYLQYENVKPVLMWSLESSKPVATARHEAIHHLYRANYFTKHEWESLKTAAARENWIDKYNIMERYGGKGDLNYKLEEAIAEEFGHRIAKKDWEGPIGKIAQRLFEFLEKVKARIKEMFGKELTADEVFNRIERGEVGSREPVSPISPHVFDPTAAQRGPKEPELPGMTRMEDREPFEEPMAVGITKKIYNLYLKHRADRQAEDLEAAQKRAEKEQRKRLTAEWKENMVAVRSKVVDEVRSRPDVLASTIFEQSKAKIGEKFLTSEQKAALPESLVGKGKDTVDPDVVAGLFGYQSGTQLIEHLADFHSKAKAANLRPEEYRRALIRHETDRQMGEKYGSLEQNILDEAKDQVLSDSEVNRLAEETYRYATKSDQEFELKKDKILEQLKKEFDETNHENISSEAFLRDAGRAAKKAEEAVFKEDFDEWFRRKQEQFFATVKAKEALKFEKEKAKFEKTAKGFKRREIPGMSQEYTDWGRDILSRVGAIDLPSMQDHQRQLEAHGYTSLIDFAATKAKGFDAPVGLYDDGFLPMGGRIIDIPEWMQDANWKKPIESLTVQEYRELKGTIDSMKKNGRDEAKIIREGEAVDKAELIADIKDQVETTKRPKQYSERKTKLGKKIESLGIWIRSMRNMETLWNWFDNDNPRGLFNKYLSYPARAAADGEAALEREVAKMYEKLGIIKDPDKLLPSPLLEPDTKTPLVGFTRKNLMAMISNMGSKKQWEWFAKSWGADPDRLRAWVYRNATKEDFDRAQEMGKIFEHLFGKTETVYRNLYGSAPARIDIEPFDTPFGTYEGWYHPIIFDPVRPGSSTALKGEAKMKAEYQKAATANGYVQRRSGYTGTPYSLTYEAIPARMSQMIHDISFRPFITEASKLIYDKRFEQIIYRYAGQHQANEMVEFLKSVAGARAINSKALAEGAKISNFFRQNTIGTYIGFNPYTALKHGPTAWAFSMNEVGAINFLSAMQDVYASAPAKMERINKFIMENSEGIQRRERHWQDVLGRQHDVLTEGGSTWRDQVIEKGAWLVSKSDLVSAKPTWWAAYQKAIGEGSNHGEAVAIAERAVVRAHGSTAITNLPAIVRDAGPTHSWLTSLYGFFGTLMNRRIEMAYKAADIVGNVKEGEITQAAKNTAALLNQFFFYIVVPTMIEEYVTSIGTDDHRGLGQRLLSGATAGVGSSVIYLRDFTHAMAHGEQAPGVGLLSSVYNEFHKLSRDIHKGREAFSRANAAKTVRDFLTVFGIATGMTPKTLNNAAMFTLRYFQGLEKPKGMSDWFIGITRGTAERRQHH